MIGHCGEEGVLVEHVRIMEQNLGTRSKPGDSRFRCPVFASLSGNTKGNSRQRNVPNLNILVAPLIEQFHSADLIGDVLGKDLVPVGRLDLDFPVVRHGE